MSRNAIERMFYRPTDFRRLATRYDRLATSFLAAISLAATVSFWLWSRPLTGTQQWASGVWLKELLIRLGRS